MPVANVQTVPVGLSLLARHGQDALLLETAKSLTAETMKAEQPKYHPIGWGLTSA